MHTLQLVRISFKSAWTTGCLLPIQPNDPYRTQCARLNARPWRFGEEGPAHNSGTPWRFPRSHSTTLHLTEEKAGGEARWILSVDQGPRVFLRGLFVASQPNFFSLEPQPICRREETLTGSSHREASLPQRTSWWVPSPQLAILDFFVFKFYIFLNDYTAEQK